MTLDYFRLLRPSRVVSHVFDIPFIERQELNSWEGLDLIAFSDTSLNPTPAARRKGVHFFIDDYRFERVYANSAKYVDRLKKYRFALSPDFSVYANQPEWLQIESVARNRWCGAYWQSMGIPVIPTVSWTQESTFAFCFAGIEKGSAVAVSTLGCRKCKEQFMKGYEAMMTAIEPELVICYSKPFPEMQGNIIPVGYLESRGGNR